MGRKTNRRFITPAELAARWGCSLQTLSNQRSAGKSKIAYYKLGHRVRYYLRDIENHERAQRIGGDGDE